MLLATSSVAEVALDYQPEEQIAARQACLQIAARLASVHTSDCELANDLEATGAISVNGTPILAKTYPPLPARQPQARVMLLGGIHADELSSVSIVFKWMRVLNKYHSGLFHWRVIPALNPDGLLRRKAQRMNANGVDLNRNFPTPDWKQRALTDYWVERTGRNPRRYPGPEPLSEPESLWLAKEIERFQPDVIVSVHAPFGVVDFDGPPYGPDKLGRLRLNMLGTYPGSLGNYAGVQKNIPVVTIELKSAGIMPKHREILRIWVDLVKWVKKNIPKDTPPVYKGLQALMQDMEEQGRSLNN
ncbi:hypothetical protein MNBD_GAMMA26-2287 [hydrothermal vent metagenome]|uniref:Peptidase M14 domain-containing protein n=1 Tax=hydrothermal vent metagenome TaxID=652676 RepID=A0A3B1BS05_9ZZZZ